MGTGNSLAMLPWFVRDYIAATRHLSLAERGAYTDLLFLSWEMGALPSDPTRLARLVGCGADEFAEVWPAICAKFVQTEAGLVNMRLEEHRAESMRRSASARASAQARWDRYGGCERNADAMRSHSERNANGHAKPMLPSPSPSPSPNPSPEGEGEARASARPPRTAARLSDGWELTEERRQVAVSEGVDPERTFAKFKDHWRAESSAKARKRDWDAAWRNWCRGEADRSRGPRPAAKPAGPSPEAAEQAAMRKLVARLDAVVPGFREPQPGETADQYRLAQDAEYNRRERERVERGPPVRPAEQSRPVGNLLARLTSAKRAPA